MRLLGKLTTLAILAGLGLGVAVGVKSVPDVRRYLEMRKM
ncbi:MAG: DUF6893 family small protein [Marmoricola sp.]